MLEALGEARRRTDISPRQPGANGDLVQGLALLPAGPQAGWKGVAERSPPDTRVADDSSDALGSE